MTFIGKSDNIVLYGNLGSELYSSIKDGQLVISGCNDACRVEKSENKSQKVIFETELKSGEELKVS